MSDRILLVEDSPVKEQQLRAALSEVAPLHVVQVARSFQSAVGAMEEFSFSLLLLDMTIPTFDRGDGESGGRPRVYGGRDVLDYVERTSGLLRVLVVSQYRRFEDNSENKDLGELERELHQQFPRTFRGAIYFDNTRADWRKRFDRRVRKALNL